MQDKHDFLTLWRNLAASTAQRDRLTARSALDEALRDNTEQALDQIVDIILRNANTLTTRVLGDDFDTCLDELRQASDFLVECFSRTEPVNPRGQRIPKGMILTDDARARGPLSALAHSARDLVPPVRKLLEVQRLLDEVRSKQEERRAAKRNEDASE